MRIIQIRTGFLFYHCRVMTYALIRSLRRSLPAQFSTQVSTLKICQKNHKFTRSFHSPNVFLSISNEIFNFNPFRERTMSLDRHYSPICVTSVNYPRCSAQRCWSRSRWVWGLDSVLPWRHRGRYRANIHPHVTRRDRQPSSDPPASFRRG